MKYERKKAAKNATKKATTSRRVVRDLETQHDDSEPQVARRPLRKRGRKKKEDTYHKFPTVPTLFPKRSPPEEQTIQRHLDYTNNLFPELSDVIGNDTSVYMMLRGETFWRDNWWWQENRKTGVKISLAGIEVTEATL